MPETRRSTTATLSLDEVIARLARQEAVEAILLVGSAAHNAMTPVSDYDLAVLFSQTPLPLHVGTTQIDGRFTDLIFFNGGHAEQVLNAAEPLNDREWAGLLVRYLVEGELVYDRDGRLNRARAKVQSGDWLQPLGDGDLFGPWSRVNFNLQVIRRYLQSDDPIYLLTADIRMAIYGPSDLFWSYFTLRKMPWRGEKEAIHYLQTHDPEYLAIFNQFISESERHAKFALYEQLAVRTVAPVGTLWRDGDAVMLVDAPQVTPKMERQALDFWEGLVASP
jgi:predicted nucleotidyltransferase